MTVRVNVNPAAVAALAASVAVVAALGREADRVADRVAAPSKFTVRTRKGVNRKGQAFSQVIMQGDGALAVEFGSVNNPAYAPLRNALRG